MFIKYPKIPRYSDHVRLCITQKLHGTNAQLEIEGDTISCYSRNRELTLNNDNAGFTAFIEANKQEFIHKLGPGRYYGEWCGPGINSGEGSSEKIFVLFNYWDDYSESGLPANTAQVPLLFSGPVKREELSSVIAIEMAQLKANGSLLVPGYMKVEGVVIDIDGIKYKKVFKPEDTKWTGVKRQKGKVDKLDKIDYSYLCQPIRLEKLLSRDERYQSIENIKETAVTYLDDLIEEGEMKDEDRRGASRIIFKFIRGMLT